MSCLKTQSHPGDHENFFHSPPNPQMQQTIILLLFLCQAAYHCLASQVSSSDTMPSETRTCAPFSSIVVQDEVEVQVVVGNSYKINVSGDNNYVPFILTDSQGDQLTVKMSEDEYFPPSEKFKVTVEVPRDGAMPIERIIARKGSLVIGEGCDTILHVESLEFVAVGSGKITANIGARKRHIQATVTVAGCIELSGSCETLTLHTVGNEKSKIPWPRFKSRALECDNVDAVVLGESYAAVNTRATLKAMVIDGRLHDFGTGEHTNITKIGSNGVYRRSGGLINPF